MEFITWRGRSQRDLSASGIYVITNLVNGKQYVGQSKHMGKRWAGHQASVYDAKCCTRLASAFREFGLEHFRIDVLEYCSVESLNAREIYYIDALGTRAPNGYNSTSGGSKRQVRVVRALPVAVIRQGTEEYNAHLQSAIPPLGAGDTNAVELRLPCSEVFADRAKIDLYCWNADGDFGMLQGLSREMVIYFSHVVREGFLQHLPAIPHRWNGDEPFTLTPAEDSLVLAFPYQVSLTEEGPMPWCPVLAMGAPPPTPFVLDVEKN